VSSSGLPASTTIYTRARALWNGSGINLLLNASGYTPTLLSTTLASGEAAPSNVRFYAIASDSISITWSLLSGASYTMVISSSSDFSTSFSSATGSINITTARYAGLFSNTTYYFKVKVSKNADAAYSSPISTYTYPPLP